MIEGATSTRCGLSLYVIQSNDSNVIMTSYYFFTDDIRKSKQLY
jgi:hypothetical protein